MSTSTQSTGLDIAVIAVSGRFPKAKSVAQFWENLQNGTESVIELSDRTLELAGVEPNLVNDPNYVKAASILEDFDLFDASFFGVNPREAEYMDPQNRIFLECAWEALETAGYDPERYKGLIGVYAGSSENTYLIKHLAQIGQAHLTDGGCRGFLATGTSYKLNLKGPSLYIQTFCSTSMVAIHLACQSLLNEECDMALAGGVSVRVPHHVGYLYGEGGIVSPDGHCRAFDAEAQGTIFGSGVGIVVLKRLEDAIADRDQIEAVIKGSAINNDGSLKVSFAAPSVDGQSEAIAEALAIADINPETISYVEAHGTGTNIGDPVEIMALTQAWRGYTNKNGFCAIGSLKSNIGHLDAAAGVASLIKTVLALKHQKIPPSIHVEHPNPKIEFENTPFYVNTILKEWKTSGDSPRRAGVSSLGVGGTNAHVILEEAPFRDFSGRSSRSHQLILLSAKSMPALEQATQNLSNYLQSNPDLDLADVAFTLQVGRRTFGYRRMLISQSLAIAAQDLKSKDSWQTNSEYQDSQDRPIVFVFLGAGSQSGNSQYSQYIDIGKELYQQEAVFRQHIDYCASYLNQTLGLDLRDLLDPTEANRAIAYDQIKQPAIAQPVIFVIAYAIAQLWLHWGIKPKSMAGAGIGEYVAACLAEIFSLDEALTLMVNLGQLLGKLMERSAEDVKTETSQTESYELITAIAQVQLKPPQIPVLSNFTNDWISHEEATSPTYWSQNLGQYLSNQLDRNTHRDEIFGDRLQQILAESNSILLEIGAVTKLSDLNVLTSLATPCDRQSEEQSSTAFLLNTLGNLWLAGANIDWDSFYEDQNRYRVILPTYPFERQRFWIDALDHDSNSAESAAKSASQRQSLTKTEDITDWFYLPLWKQTVFSTLPNNLLGNLSNKQMEMEKQENPQRLCWLVFTDSINSIEDLSTDIKSISTQLVNSLKPQEVVTVSIGSQFSKIGENNYAINPQNQADYVILFNTLQAIGKQPTKILHLWNIDWNIDWNIGSNQTLEFEEIQYLGFYSLIFIAQALDRLQMFEDLEIIAISDNLQSVIGSESVCPAKATLLAPCKTIPQEYPHIKCRSIDITLPQIHQTNQWQSDRLLAQLLSEIASVSSDPIVAYRNYARWTQSWEPMQLTPSDQISSSTQPLRQNGVYLITGGLGRIGLVLAEYLASKVQAKLILIGRSPFLDRAEWDCWLTTHSSEDLVSQKIEKLRHLESLGSEVLVISVDIANKSEMQPMLAEAEAKLGTINGVIHGAGVLQSGKFSEISAIAPLDCAQQFQPKVYGLMVLDELFGDRNLDFCILMSSLAAILGGLGMTAYTAANLFMDGFVAAKGNPKWKSLNWDSWNIEEAKNAISSEGSSLLEFSMTANEGNEALGRILAIAFVPQIAIATANLSIRFEQWIKPHISSANLPANLPANLNIKRNVSENIKGDSNKAMYARPNLPTAFAMPSNQIEQIISKIWQNILGIDQIGINDNFFSLGGDSFLLIQIRQQLQIEISRPVPTVDLFEYPTISSLANHLSKGESNRVNLETTSQKNISDRAAKQQAAMAAEANQRLRRSKDHG